MALPPEKINELKQVIHAHLSNLDIHGQIRNVLSESLRENQLDQENVQESNLLERLKERGIVDDIMKSLEFKGLELKSKSKVIDEGIVKGKNEKSEKWIPDEDKKFPIDPAKRYIYLQLVGGKAFLEHLQDPEVMPGQVTSTFTVHLQFMGQRYQSRPVPCACEPAFEEGFLLEIRKRAGGNDKQQDTRNLLSVGNKIHLVLIRTDKTGETHLLGSYYLEWRGILSTPNGQMRSSIEMNGVGPESKVPVGIIDIKMDLIPRASEFINKEVVTTQLNLEKSRLNERERLFLAYSKQWWREFLQIRASHSNRLVKIFAQDENCVHNFVCSYVKPLRSGRLLDTARQAARFVALFRHEKHPTMSGTKTDMWTTMHSFVVRGKGDVEDHAVLLCSLLLGFGLNAYVCIGTKAKGVAHAWVVTIAADGSVQFWESLTAQRYKHEPIHPEDAPGEKQPTRDYPYRTVGCLFNNEEFYANTQPTDGVHVCSFKLHDESLWKRMSEDAIKSICGPGLVPAPLPLIHLTPSTLDPIMKSHQLEVELRALVNDHRTDLGLGTRWDEDLSYLLSPALAAYEFEHVSGVTAGNDDFQNAIRRNVPEGHTFKGFPIQFIHTNARKAFATCLRAPICEEIICCRGDQVKLGLRVRIFPYPENTCATWVMFAVKYKSIL